MELLLLSTLDAAKLIGVGRTHFYAMHSSGRLGPLPIRLGKRTLWNRAELESWVNGGCVSRERWQAEKKEEFSQNNRE